MLSFSLSAELLEVSAGAGEGMPDEDSSWLVVFDVFWLYESAPATLLNVTTSRTPSTSSTEIVVVRRLPNGTTALFSVPIFTFLVFVH